MLRLFFIYIVPFFLPTAFFLTYRRFKPSASGKKTPYLPLFSLGLILTASFLCLFATNDKAPAFAVYTPPKYVDGRLVPANMNASEHR